MFWNVFITVLCDFEAAVSSRLLALPPQQGFPAEIQSAASEAFPTIENEFENNGTNAFLSPFYRDPYSD